MKIEMVNEKGETLILQTTCKDSINLVVKPEGATINLETSKFIIKSLQL